MGDRANIAIEQNIKTKDGEKVYIYFYTHWDGSNLPFILQSALLRGKGRWGDNSYLNRIIFSEMIKDDLLEDTGYGIDTQMPDNQHDIIYLSHENKTVTIGEKTWTFEEYVQANLN